MSAQSITELVMHARNFDMALAIKIAKYGYEKTLKIQMP
jgi:hypothetical protein